MRQKSIFSLLVILLSYSSVTFGQEIISSSGEEYITNEAQIEFTIGETMSGSYLGPMHLTEGFHQGTDNEVSIFEPTRNENFSVYPNPSVDEIFIQTNEFQNTTAMIIDAHGRVIQSDQLYSNRSQIDIKNLSSGVYILQLKNPTLTFQSIQIIKTK